MSSTAVTLPPVTGAWREGDPVGRRQWITLPAPLALEAGGELPDVRLAYETWGTLAPDGSNAVLVLHAATGDSHVTGPAEPGHPTPGWWGDLIGPGKALDPERWFVVAPNVVGGCQGSTGPSSVAPDGQRWGSRFPLVTPRDTVASETVLADVLGVERWACVIGGSMGGMRALEWAATTPDRVERLMVLAAPAVTSAEQIAWAACQLAAIRADPGWRGGDYYDAAPGEGPHTGLAVARRMAHLSYRSPFELATRFGREPQVGEDPLNGGRYAVESYLDHHGAKLLRRFDAGSYVRLTEMMNAHDVGRDRGGVTAALARVRARTVAVGISSDRLYPVEEQDVIAAGVPGARLQTIESPYGHDGFLIEWATVGRLLGDLLDE